jgi:hypothetical protein
MTYLITSDFVFNFQGWDFQSTIPVKWSEYRAAIPEYYNYDVSMRGYIALAVNEKDSNSKSITYTYKDRSGGLPARTGQHAEIEHLEYRENKYRWVAQDVPAFKIEPFLTTYRDYISRINFELEYTQFPNSPAKYYRGTWETLNEQLLASPMFGGMLTGSTFLDKSVEESTAGMSTTVDKLKAIYSFVKENVEWNEMDSKYAPDGFRKVIDSKKGSAGEINLLLVTMLLKAGLTADPVLISTRDNGFVREDSPMSSQFNYVIAAVRLADKIILLDATDRSLPMNILPERCLNVKGYAISEKNPGWVKLAPNFKSRTITNIDLALGVDGELNGKINFSREGYDAQEMRKKYFSKGEADYLKEIAESHAWELHKSEFENVKKISEPVKEMHELTISEHSQVSGGVIYLNPLLIHRMEENQFKAETREYPVDFGSPFEQLYMGKITIPNDLVVEELPKPKVIVLPENGGRYTYSLTQMGNTIMITSQFAINRSLFAQTEYAHLREFYNQVVAKQAEQIVLKKK